MMRQFLVLWMSGVLGFTGAMHAQEATDPVEADEAMPAEETAAGSDEAERTEPEDSVDAGSSETEATVTLINLKEPGDGPTVVVPLEGPVTKAQFVFLRRALKEASAMQAGAFILEMDTPGGELQTSIEMVDALQRSGLFTVTYINTNAASAGALISLGTDRIYMAPVSAIGAAAPVAGSGEQIPETMNEKIVSYYSKYFRSSAEMSGHNPDLAEAFVDKRKEVIIDGVVISPADSLLTLSPQEAVREFNGKPLLAAGIAKDLDEVVSMQGLSTEIIHIEPSGFEVLAFYITLFAPLFMLGGIIGAYIEFKSPGFGVPGVIAALCFLIFFAGHSLAGLTGHETMAVFVLGLVLILVEVIFFPGVIVVALLGVLLVFGALFWAMVDRYPDQEFVPMDPSVFVTPAINMGIAIGGGLLIVFVLANFLPKSRLFERIVLQTSLAGGGSLALDETDNTDGSGLTVGMTGRALTLLRPSGTAEFQGRVLDVMSEGGIIRANSPVRIVATRNSHWIVAAIPDVTGESEDQSRSPNRIPKAL